MSQLVKLRTTVIEWILAICLVTAAAAVWHFTDSQQARADNTTPGNGVPTDDMCSGS